MNKRTQIALIVVILALLVLSLLIKEKNFGDQELQTYTYRDSLDREQKKTAKLGRRVDKLEERNTELQTENDQLTKKNRILKDSVKALNKKVRVLNKKLQKQTTQIAANEAKLNALRGKSDKLVDRVADLRKQKGSDKKLIQILDDQRAELDKEVGRVFMKNDSLERKALEGTKELASLTKTFDDKEKTLQIVENARVTFDNVIPRKSNNKAAKRLKDWKYTLINLQLAAPSLEMLRGETFIVKIIDKNSGKILSPREASGKNDTLGEKFIFNGNPVPPIKYINYEKKTGKNYMVQVFYIKDRKEYPLSFGSKDVSF